MSAVIQITGFNQSIVRVGAPWIGRGIAKYLGNPLGLTRTVHEMSDFMANRARTRFRELNELRNQVQDQSAFNEFIGRYAYFMMMRVQQVVDVPTWWGAYEKAIAAGNEETRAVALADQAVIDAQGSGQTKDLSAIERGGPALRLFTVFYSFMNTALNLGVEIGDAELPGLQKKIIRESLARNKVVITATQMLQSMVESPIPTRAEVLDVANAVIDGSDALMLSAETASGKHPDKAVAAMRTRLSKPRASTIWEATVRIQISS